MPYRFDYGSMAFIGFNSQLYNERRRTRDLDKKAFNQWGKIRRFVKEATKEAKRIVLFHHIPSYPNFFRDEVKRTWQNRYLRQFQNLLRSKSFSIDAVFSGHFHRDEWYVYHRTLLFNVPPVSEKYTRNSSYRIVRVTPEGMNYRQIYTDRETERLSYELDLHQVTGATHREWVDDLTHDELWNLWRYRNAGDDDTERWLDTLAVKEFRNFLQSPFRYQPPGEGRKTEKKKLIRTMPSFQERSPSPFLPPDLYPTGGEVWRWDRNESNPCINPIYPHPIH